MSRVGSLPISVSSAVKADVSNGLVSISGPRGSLSHDFGASVKISHSGDVITVSPADDTAHSRAMWGTARSIISNMVNGVEHGYSKELKLVGVGYRAQVVDNSAILLSLGYSHMIMYVLPGGISAKCDKDSISISGVDKQLVGEVAAKLRSFRKPEPYNGKGVMYAGETIRRKESKKK